MILRAKGEPVGLIIDPRVCAWLEDHAGLRTLRTATRGMQPEMFAALDEIREVADAWRSSAVGTVVARKSEPTGPSSRWMSTREVGDHLGIGARAVVKAIARDHLPAEKVNGCWQIDREDLAHYEAERERTRR